MNFILFDLFWKLSKTLVGIKGKEPLLHHTGLLVSLIILTRLTWVFLDLGMQMGQMDV